METLFMPAFIGQAPTSEYPNYKNQEVNQGKDAAIHISVIATGTT